ncbi:MAG: LytTR family DNA-binding domain-containing protein [Bacteroidota bacterium]
MRQLTQCFCLMVCMLLCLSGNVAMADSLPLSLQKLAREAAQSGSDSLRCQYYAQLSRFYRLQTDIDRQATAADTAMLIAREANQPILRLIALDAKARSLWVQNQPDEAIASFDQAESLSQQDPSILFHPFYLRMLMEKIRQESSFYNRPAKENVALVLTILSQIEGKVEAGSEIMVLERLILYHRSMNQLDQALMYNDRALDLLRKIDDPETLVRARITDIDIYYNLIAKPLDTVLLAELIGKCAATYQYSLDAKQSVYSAWPLLYWGKFYRFAKDFAQGRNILTKIDEHNAETRVLFSKYDLLTEIEQDADNWADMYIYARQTQRYAQEARHDFFQLKANNSLLTYFLHQQEKDSATRYAELVQRGLKRVDTSQFLEVVYQSFELLSEQMRDIDLTKALSYLATANAIREKRSRYQQRAIANIAAYRKEQERLLIQQQNLHHWISWLGGFLILAFILGMWYYQWSKKVQARQEKDVLRIQENASRDFLLLNNKSKVYLDELFYIKSDGNYLEFHLTDRRLLDRNRLKVVATTLPTNFVQVHRSYLINRNAIKIQQANSLIMENGVEIPISRTFKARLHNLPKT